MARRHTSWMEFGLLLCVALGAHADLELARNGATGHVIVEPESATALDDYAVRELAHYLKESTGAEFEVVRPNAVPDTKEAIFVGVSAPMRKRLRDDTPLSELKEQQHVVRSEGQDVFLYGKGVHGNKDAVFEFLQASLGWRWFSVYEHPVVPANPTLILKPFNRIVGFDFPVRRCNGQLNRKNLDFSCQHGMNRGFDGRVRQVAQRYGPEAVANLSHCVDSRPGSEVGGHSLFYFIPPTPQTHRSDLFDWRPNNYFETHPDFFSLSENGRRLPDRQLCFGNPELRLELTRNIFEFLKRNADRPHFGLGAMDTPGPFCHCPACRKLEEKYGSPGGPIFDYLIELCRLLAERHPEATVTTFAYRHCQTQTPVKLPQGEKLPDNLIVDFAPIEDCCFADWLNHHDEKTQRTYHDLRGWCDIAAKVHCWMYPNPYRSALLMPVANVERVVNTIRLMKKAGVTGFFADDSGTPTRAGFSELQTYLVFHLLKDADSDTDALIREFTDHMYGAAGALMRDYIADVEKRRIAMPMPPDCRYRSSYEPLVYLIPANIHRWQLLFDRMESLVADGPARLLVNLRLARRELDFATLWKWFDLIKAFPNDYRDYKLISKRIREVNAAEPLAPTAWEIASNKSVNRKASPLGEEALDDFSVLIEAGGEEKPLPPEFEAIDRSRIRTFVPKRGRGRPSVLLDPDAAFGYAAVVDSPDNPFHFGFYQNDAKVHGPSRVIKPTEVQPGGYQLFKLGIIDLTPTCTLWFSNKSWSTSLSLGERLFNPGEDNQWEAYASLKFDGPSYNGKGEEDQVLCDRVLLVKRDGT